MQLDVLNSKGEVTGRKVELPEDIFNIEPNDHVIYLAVKQYRAAQRLGLHSTKTRAEVKGASRKLHKQKGTGGARKGNIRNPLYKGGGTINGPKPHLYDFKLNRKVKDLAKISALSHKARANQIVILEDLNMDTPKTKQMVDVLASISKGARKSLLVLPSYDENVYLSTRNIQGNKTIVLSDMNTYDLVDAGVIILSESAAKFFTDEAIEVVA
jgi:large subunit ribosomal protein L4